MNSDILPPLRDVIAAHGLKAQKSLGQNFLLDQNITDKIVRAAGDISGVTVFEIGPGPGGLTRSLLQAGAEKVIAVEFDPRAVAALEDLKDVSEGRLEVLQGDALKTDLLPLAPAPRMIVANLPYNIATPLLIGWLRQTREVQDAYTSMILMFQKEVAERITARPGTKTYGRLSVLAQWLCKTRRVFNLPPGAFTPPPKVSSSIVEFIPKSLDHMAPDFEAVEAVTAAAFSQRRKMIKTSLKSYAARLEALGIDPKLRAENLSVEDYINIVSGV